MLIFHARVEARALWRRRGLMSVVGLILMLGIAAVMIPLVPSLKLQANPSGEQGLHLYNVQLDNQAPNSPYAMAGEPPVLMSYQDAMALASAWTVTEQVMMYPAFVMVAQQNQTAKRHLARVTTATFFSMFGPKFLFGSPWKGGEHSKNVVVLSADLNQELFGGANSVGLHVMLDGEKFEVVGVLDDWLPIPRYFDLRNGPLDAPESLYMPFRTGVEMGVQRSGSRDCWPPYRGSEAELLTSECIWLNFWVQLESAELLQSYDQFLTSYSHKQIDNDRFPNGVNHRLYNVAELLRSQQLIPAELKTQLILAVLFFVFCLLNALILTATYASARQRDMFVHRVLGATHRSLMVRQLIQALMLTIGVASGALVLVAVALAFERSFVTEMQYVAVLGLGSWWIAFSLALVGCACAFVTPWLFLKSARFSQGGRA